MQDGRWGKKNNRGLSGLKVILPLVAIVILSVTATAAYFQGGGAAATRSSVTSSTTTPSARAQPIILYVNQGNGAVNESNFGSMLSFASSKGFNTIFFQVYRSGNLLFSGSQLSYFSTEAHSKKLTIFFALYFSSPDETIPTSVYGAGEDGISLDMSTLDSNTQGALLSTLKSGYHGLTAVTTLDFSTTLKPDLLVLETYGLGDRQYIHKGVIASVGVFTTSSKEDYYSQFYYALDNSDGVMVFDYATLLARGY